MRRMPWLPSSNPVVAAQWPSNALSLSSTSIEQTSPLLQASLQEATLGAKEGDTERQRERDRETERER